MREFINSRAIALESQHLEAAKQHILAQLQKGLDVESYDILRREGLNRTAELNSKTTIATWAHCAIKLLGEAVSARKKLVAGKPNPNPKAKSIYDRLTGRKETALTKKESTKDSVVCFGCKETGHVKRDCPKGQGGQVCYNCQKIGHISANCPEKRQEKGAGKDKKKEAGEKRVSTSDSGRRSGTPTTDDEED